MQNNKNILKNNVYPDFSEEIYLQQKDHAYIIGVDEVGRGPLAGPVYAAAVHFPKCTLPECLQGRVKDSKKIPKSQMARIAKLIQEHTLNAIGVASVEEIGQLNILHASMLAMRRAIENLALNFKQSDRLFLLIDGNRAPETIYPNKTIVKGDSKSLSIAAASILAKHARDIEMKRLDEAFPSYGWAQNAGYPTIAHRKALAEFGKTIHHRDGFKLL